MSVPPAIFSLFGLLFLWPFDPPEFERRIRKASSSAVVSIGDDALSILPSPSSSLPSLPSALKALSLSLPLYYVRLIREAAGDCPLNERAEAAEAAASTAATAK